MQNAVDLSGRPFHFIGIGGIGMSALAQILTHRLLPVSGSDVRNTHITQKLQSLGAHIFWQQQAENLDYFLDSAFDQGAAAQSHPSGLNSAEPGLKVLPQVICSTAIQADNAEYQAALRLECPIFHRSDVLAALISEASQSIAVGGTHGKTTTSSLIGCLLLQAGLDPTIVVGGEVAAWQGNARAGNSDYLVAEADESDGSLVKFHAAIGVITNIELDHPDHYSSLEDVVQIFQQFTDHSKQMVLCADCANIQTYLMSRPEAETFVTYGLDPENNADYTATNITYAATYTSASVYERGQCLGELKLGLLGRHNLSNALAAIAVGRLVGLSFETIASALVGFEGARRRFEHRGEAQGICLIDDYAHHPSEVRATLSSAKLRIDDAKASGLRRVVAVFQPHRYSRTYTFLQDFSQSFADADYVITTDIYSAGEAKPANISGAAVAAAIAEYNPEVSFQPTLADVVSHLKANLKSGDLVIFLGAGNLNQVIPELLTYLQESASDHHPEVALR
ncbi:MAG TPA: UDP-N-acetylmuramate--L-alanine ligase [Stenomitos sp.]